MFYSVFTAWQLGKETLHKKVVKRKVFSKQKADLRRHVCDLYILLRFINFKMVNDPEELIADSKCWVHWAPKKTLMN